MNQITFSFSKFNSIFLPKFLLMCIPGIVCIVVILCALSGKIGAISSDKKAAVIACIFMAISMIMLVLSLPWYLSSLSQYRNSYIVKKGNEIVYYKCANNLPILDEKTKVYTARDIVDIKLENKIIYIKGSIEETHIAGRSSKHIGELEELKIPDVFSNTNILFNKEN